MGRFRFRGSVTACAGATTKLLVAVVLLLTNAAGAQEVRTLNWSDLRPNDDPICEAAFSLSRSPAMCEGAPSDLSYYRCASETAALPEGDVRIAGYAHPVEMEFTDIYRFLLMPPLVRCHHPPAPMANQIIFVESTIPIDASFDPIFVTGRLRRELSLHGMTRVQYRMDATAIEPAFIPDVKE